MTHISSIWSSSDDETSSQPPTSIYQSFITVKHFFEPELQLPPQVPPPSSSPNPNTIPSPVLSSSSDSSQNSYTNNINTLTTTTNNNNTTLLSLKTNRNEIGPHIPPSTSTTTTIEERKIYQGMNINPTEAHLYAQYIRQGKRIPRRGEVGITSQEIAYLESLGYVMSGSRHKKMNAVRQRIESKVYSAEDKRALAIFNLEENIKKEKNIINSFKTLMNQKPK
jgi:hypothetical protein